MVKTSFVLTGVLMVAVGCGKGGSKAKDVAPAKLDKPELVAKMYAEAAKTKDTDKMWSLYSKQAREGFTKMVHGMVEHGSDEDAKKQFGVSKKQLMAKTGIELWHVIASAPMIKKQMNKRKDVPLTNVRAEVKGDSGKVLFDRGKEHCRISVVKEGGSWLMKYPSVACRSASDKKMAPKTPHKEPPPKAVAPKAPTTPKDPKSK